MWRAVWQRLGIGYILLLPALFVLGCAVDSGVQALCYGIDPILEDITGRSMALHSDALTVVLRWFLRNPECIAVGFVLPWWVGAWALLRPPEAVAAHAYWQVVFAVGSAVMFQFGCVHCCCASHLQKLSLGRYASGIPLVACALGVVLVCFVVLAVISAFRIRSKNKIEK